MIKFNDIQNHHTCIYKGINDNILLMFLSACYNGNNDFRPTIIPSQTQSTLNPVLYLMYIWVSRPELNFILVLDNA